MPTATLVPTKTVTLDLPVDLADQLHALPPALLHQLLVDALNATPSAAQTDAALWDDYDPAAEPIDEEFIAELIAADEETKRVGLIPFEKILRQAEEDDGPGFLERLRARSAADKAKQTSNII